MSEVRYRAVTLSADQARECVRLLGLLQNFLESAITTSLIPGTSKAMAGDEMDVAYDRQDWRAAENFVGLLTRKEV